MQIIHPGTRVLAIVLLLITAGIDSTHAQTASITGTVHDAESGESLIGANVVIEGSAVGTTSDLDGHYVIKNVAPGSYNLVFSYIGYNSTTVRNVDVVAGKATTINLSLTPEAIGMDEVVVEAEAVRNSEGALLRERQKAAAVSDAISAEAIGRSGSSTAADAMKNVTGASVANGRYVYVRGLGDRYVNTQLNGANLPSADPDRNSVQLDLFPANLLDNIITAKTFTPDQPGSFSGGTVNIATRRFPERFTLQFSSSISASSNVGVNADFLSYHGGEAGWLGMNGGTHELPPLLEDGEFVIPTIGQAYTDADAAQQLDEASKAFNGVMAPSRLPAPISQSYSISTGNQIDFLGRPLGVIGSLSYSRNATGYEGGTTGRYNLTGHVSETDVLNNDFHLADSRGVDEVLWGALFNVAYRPHPKHDLGFNFMRSNGGESEARFQTGSFPRDLGPNATYETRSLRYTERQLNSIQLRGEHALSNRGARIEWNATTSKTMQDEPDLRFFTNNFTLVSRDGTVDTVHAIRPDIYPVPTRYFRRMDEDTRLVDASVAFPVRQWAGLPAQIKIGGTYGGSDRHFRERRFEFRQDRTFYSGDPFVFFDQKNLGISESESTDRFFRFGNFVIDATQASSNYDGSQRIGAGFAMIDLPLTRRLRAIAGLRLETTDMAVLSHDDRLEEGRLDERDILPSVNLVYQTGANMNVRAAYGRTLARPTFREIAPYASFNFVGDYIFVGNPDLKRTLIDNYDARWEWFTRSGEIIAVSAFYKYFRNPIEKALNPIAANPEVQFRNVDYAEVLGLELEARKSLDQIGLNAFQIGANVSLVRSRVDIAADELELIRSIDPDASASRDLQGQSPYTVNVDVTYDNPSAGTSVSAYYNVFGSRLDRVATGATPDVYEQPFHQLDLMIRQRLVFGFDLRGSVKNLLNQAHEFAHSYKGSLFISEGYGYGRSYSLGLSYNIE